MFFFWGGGGGQSLMMKDLHRFIKHFVIKLHGIIWIQMEGDWAYFNSLKNPSLSDQFHVSNCLFSRENEPVLLKFSWGEPPDSPPPQLPRCSDTMLKKKEEIKRYKQTVA